ncbi:cistern family PEP-CTERM protein [Sphingobium sufflavum]|uniref:cistern family PEP-CTERM protein n=1 Tax=Sphingobium sufflavum TaxID=1129547 RepID=UPI001F1E6EDB|nr:cistern family PEP-CTERM protein [Sphingobium sufflavum]
MKILLACLFGTAFAASAQAAVVIHDYNVGRVITVQYRGYIDNDHGGKYLTPLITALQTITFTGVSNGGKTYNFSVSTSNTSSVSSLLRSFAFDVETAKFKSASATGKFKQVYYNTAYPLNSGTRDVCFTVTSASCTTHDGGLAKGTTATSTFSLTFKVAPVKVALDDFVAKLHTLNPRIDGETYSIAYGTASTATPETATWVMMLLGFGAVGGAMRRRRELSPLQIA